LEILAIFSEETLMGTVEKKCVYQRFRELLGSRSEEEVLGIYKLQGRQFRHG